MNDKYINKIKGLTKEEQSSFIMMTLRDNIPRLKFIMIMLLGIQVITLVLLLFPSIKISSPVLQPTIIKMFIVVIVYSFLFTALLHMMGNSLDIKKALFFRLVISTGLMLLLFWAIALRIIGYESFLLPNFFVLMLIAISSIPFFNYLEIIAIMLPSQLFLTFFIITDNSISQDPSLQLLFSTWGYVFLAIIISSLIYFDRIQYFKKDLQLTKQNALLKLHSEIDALTNVYNRRKLDETMGIEWKRSSRTEKAFSFLLIDLDHFKSYNDTYGHIEGDLCLRKSAAIMSNTLMRSSDKICRYGGEEFGVILPFTDIKAAEIVAEKLRKNIENAKIIHSESKSGFLTISIGITAAIGNKDGNYSDMYIEADKALYAAKRSGRNKIIAFEK